MEVYVAGCCCGASVISTQTLELISTKKNAHPSTYEDDSNDINFSLGDLMSQGQSRFPDSRHKTSKEALSVNGLHNSFLSDHLGCEGDTVGLLAELKACTKIKDLCRGRALHAKLIQLGLLESDIYVSTILMNMYAKCGALGKAQEVFDDLPVRDVVAWSSLIVGYAQHGQGYQALQYFEWMERQGFTPDAVTYIGLLQACGNIGALCKGEELHFKIIKQGLAQHNVFLDNALVDMYARCGRLTRAQEAFDALPAWDVVSWNALIAGYTQHGHGKEALNCYERMQYHGTAPNASTFSSILKACGSIGATTKGAEIHAEIVRQGLVKKNALVANALVGMYAKCGNQEKAQEVFDEIEVPTLGAWNALITGYAQQGCGHEALKHFEEMQQQGSFPDAITLTCILKACSTEGAGGKGEEIHAEIVKWGLLEKDALLATALVDMYAKCGNLQRAQQVFNDLRLRDTVSWSALITGYAQHGYGDEAVSYFHQMQQEGFSPDAVSFICAIKAYGAIGASQKGEQIHADVVTQGLLENNIPLGSALIDMYGKCGLLAKAQDLFDELSGQHVHYWNALIAGYTQLGKVEIVLNYLSEMSKECIKPDTATFTLLLTACSHSGLVEKGPKCFEIIKTEYGHTPTLEHHNCMVDLFGRAELFERAIEVIEKLSPSVPSDCLHLWITLLGACRTRGNAKFGKLAFMHVSQLNENGASAVYVAMSSIYAAATCMEEDTEKVEAVRPKKHTKLG